MYSSYRSRIKWKEPKLAALRKVKSRIIIELQRKMTFWKVTYCCLQRGTKHRHGSQRDQGVFWHKGVGNYKSVLDKECFSIILQSWPIAIFEIAHFRVAGCLSFKTSPGAQPFKWKWVAYSSANQTHFPFNSWAPRLTSKPRQTATRKWPIPIIQFILGGYLH